MKVDFIGLIWFYLVYDSIYTFISCLIVLNLIQYIGGDDHVTDPHNLYYPKNAEEQQFNGTGCPRVVSIQNVNYKLVYRGTDGWDISEFYDIKNDPQELNNLFYNNSIPQKLIDAKMALMSNLTNWYLLTADITPILTDPRGLPPAGPSYTHSFTQF